VGFRIVRVSAKLALASNEGRRGRKGGARVTALLMAAQRALARPFLRCPKKALLQRRDDEAASAQHFFDGSGGEHAVGEEVELLRRCGGDPCARAFRQRPEATGQ